VTSFATEKFWKAFEKLPPRIQRKARASYQLWKKNPYHPSLQFKHIHTVKPIYSSRVGDWRAVGVRDGNVIVWFWIGSHEEYNKLIAQL
jgi:mRNA-degrading endonuclease RelE of RelBE toxin-antitoxin system